MAQSLQFQRPQAGLDDGSFLVVCEGFGAEHGGIESLAQGGLNGVFADVDDIVQFDVPAFQEWVDKKTGGAVGQIPDEWEIGVIGDVHRCGVTGSFPGDVVRHGQIHRILEEQFLLQVPMRDGVHRNDAVQLVVQQHGFQLHGDVGIQVDFHVGMGDVVPGDDVGGKSTHSGDADADGDFAGVAAVDFRNGLAHVSVHGFLPEKHITEHFTGRGQLHLRLSNYQRGSVILFQLLDVLTDSLLGDENFVRGTSEIEGFTERQKGAFAVGHGKLLFCVFQLSRSVND